jgi:hypothetical protein
MTHVFGSGIYWNGGEGGIRTPDTVARMPHFECGAFNRSATSPQGRAKLERCGAVLAAARRRHKSQRALCAPL